MMDKIGGFSNFQARGVNQSQSTSSTESSDTASTVDNASKSMDDVLFTTQDGTEITRGDLKRYLTLKMAVDLTSEVGNAVNGALASIKSDGDSSGESGSSGVQSTTDKSVNLLSMLLKGSKIKDRLENMSDTANGLTPNDSEKYRTQLTQISDANKANQKDLSAYFTELKQNSNTEQLQKAVDGLKKLIGPLSSMLP